jgi:hypothetical protein
MTLPPKVPKDTLVINQNDSICGNCKRRADPEEKSHETVSGSYGSPKQKGCGQVWKHVASYTYGIGESVRRMRPDLEFIQLWKED